MTIYDDKDGREKVLGNQSTEPKDFKNRDSKGRFQRGYRKDDRVRFSPKIREQIPTLPPFGTVASEPRSKRFTSVQPDMMKSQTMFSNKFLELA